MEEVNYWVIAYFYGTPILLGGVIVSKGIRRFFSRTRIGIEPVQK